MTASIYVFLHSCRLENWPISTTKVFNYSIKPVYVNSNNVATLGLKPDADFFKLKLVKINY